MTPEHFLKLKQLLGDAMDRPEHEQESWLLQACGSDRKLYLQVMALLKGDDAASMHMAGRLETLQEEDLTGKVLDGWRLEALLGRGGMGEVWQAVPTDGQGDSVAIKLVHRDRCSPQVFSRFQRERQILANLKHPQIAGLIDAGRTDDGRPYLVMPLVDGKEIDIYCKEQHLPRSDIIRLFQLTCEVVAFAHERGVVHRDIKASNVMVGQNGEPLLMDFGIARLMDDPDLPVANNLSITRSGEFLMTPAYASPEQLRGLQATPASDVYTLGLLLYQLLSGSAHAGNFVDPEGGARALLLELDAMDEQARLDGALVQVLKKALALDPDNRYQDGKTLSKALVAYREDSSPSDNSTSSNRKYWLWVLVLLIITFLMFFIR